MGLTTPKMKQHSRIYQSNHQFQEKRKKKLLLEIERQGSEKNNILKIH